MTAVILSGVVAAFWPRIACRLAVAVDEPPRACCPRCHLPFAAGWRGWIRPGAPCRSCPAGHTWWLAIAGCAAAAAALTGPSPSTGPAHLALLVTWLVVAQACTLLTLIDLAALRLPTVLVTATGVAVCIGVVVAASVSHRPQWTLSALLGAAALGGSYLLIAVLAPGQIGMGDVRLSAVLGAALGIGGWQTLLLGALLPYIAAFPFALMQLQRDPPSQRGQMPFGPFLAAGAVMAAALTGY